MPRSDGSTRVVVVGGGRFATDFVRALLACDDAYEVVQLQRSESHVPRDDPRLRTHVDAQFRMTWVLEHIVSTRPRVVLVANSAASPYRRVDGLSSLPFGASAPLQTTYLLPIAQLVRDLGPDAPLLVNACYPDVTNQIAALSSTPVDLGVGNGQALGAYLSDGRDSPTYVLGHHIHLYPPVCPEDELLAWDEQGDSLGDVGGLLQPFRRLTKERRNKFSAQLGAEELHQLLAGGRRRMNITAPSGLGGTVPCDLVGATIRPAIEEFMPLTDARARLESWSRLEGVHVDTALRSVVFHGPVAEYYEEHLGVSIVHVADWTAFSAAVEELVTDRRERQPAATYGGTR